MCGSFMQHNTFSLYPCCCMYMSVDSSLSLLNNIHCWCYPNLFICLPADGPLGGLQFGVIVNKAAINICIQVLV